MAGPTGGLLFQIPLQAIFLSLLVHTLWGGVAVAGKFGLEAFPPFYSAFIRFVFGMLTVLMWCRIRGLRVWPHTDEWRPIVGISLLFTLQIGVMNLGFDKTSGVNASILISVNPLFAALFAHLLLRNDRLTLLRVCGLLLAFLGVVLTMLPAALTNRGFASSAVSFGNLGDWLCLASAGMLGLRLIVSAKVMQDLSPIRLAFWQMVLSLPLFLLFAATFETVDWENYSHVALLALAYQGVVLAGVGFMVSLWLISRYRASTMTSFNFVAPVSGVFLSAWLLNEALTGQVLLGVLLVGLGMLLVTVKKPGS